jgi:hypothetical protein
MTGRALLVSWEGVSRANPAVGGSQAQLPRTRLRGPLAQFCGSGPDANEVGTITLRKGSFVRRRVTSALERCGGASSGSTGR